MSKFINQEPTIEEIHKSYQTNTITAEALVKAFLARIEAYDKNGPGINAIVTINPDAKKRAAELDEQYEKSGSLVGPLHGIPVLVKDQVETAGLETSFGSILFEKYVPEQDAEIVRRLREAGAIILAKTTMPDWASSWIGYSSHTGRTKNPYALDRDPGGSSSGTAVGITSNFASIGIGEDTGGSIRLPASFNNLFGIRVTTGLISRNGVSPLVKYQDTLGPMTRTMDDLTRILDVIVGYDSKDEFTAATELADVNSYMDYLDPDGLVGKRIGVLKDGFGPNNDPKTGPVNNVVRDALEAMEQAGAELIDPVHIPDLGYFVDETVLYILQSKHDLNEFLNNRPDTPVDSITEIYESGKYHDLLGLLEEIATGAPDDPSTNPEYWRKVAKREHFRRAILTVFAEHDLDAIAYPSSQTLPPTDKLLRAGKWEPPKNPLIAPQSNCPAISIPGGFTDKKIPVGVELLGKPFMEHTLIQIASGFEANSLTRSAPATTSPIDK